MTQKTLTLIRSKAEFQALSDLGRVGNQFRSWGSPGEALLARPAADWFYIRGPYAGWKWMNPSVPRVDLLGTVNEIEKLSGDPRSGYRFVEVLPFGTPRYLNAEAGRFHHGVELRWADSSDLSLREDLEKNGEICVGLQAVMIMRSRVPPEDLEMLYDIWDDFPGAVIEFSVYSKPCGQLNRQTIVWEVRHY